MFKGFEPVFNEESRVLIIGSFPSVKSRENGFYYGNNQNRFWKTLAKVFDEKIINDNTFKKEFLLSHKIALYDIVDETDLKGSSDFNLVRSKLSVVSLDFLLPPHTKVEKIICNGKTAYNLCQIKKYDVPIIYLSSTSSANPRFSFEEWKKALEFIKN